MDCAPPILFPKRLSKHVKHCAAPLITIDVENCVGIGIILGNNRTSYPSVPVFKVLFLIISDIEVKEIVFSEMMLIPKGLEVGCKALVKPQVRPTTAGYVISEPLVSKFVRLNTVTGLIEFLSSIVNDLFGLCRGRNILHTSTEVSRDSLCILCIRILYARLF